MGMERNAIAPAPSDRILRKPAVLTRIGVSDTTLWRMVKAGRFPAPVRLSPGTVGWHESDVSEWMATRMPVNELARRLTEGLTGLGGYCTEQIAIAQSAARQLGSFPDSKDTQRRSRAKKQ